MVEASAWNRCSISDTKLPVPRTPIPKADRSVLTGDEYMSRVRVKGCRFNLIARSKWRRQFATGTGVSHSHLPLARGNNHQAAIVAELSIGRLIGVPPDMEQLGRLREDRADPDAVQTLLR